MIQEIPYKYDPAYKKDKKPEMSDYLLHYEYNKVMLLKEKEGYRIPAFQDLLFEEDFREKGYYLFSIGDRGYYLVDDMKVPEFGGFVLMVCRSSGKWNQAIRLLPVLQEARSTAGERAGASVDAAAGKWSLEQQNGPWCVLPVGIQSILRSARQ